MNNNMLGILTPRVTRDKFLNLSFDFTDYLSDRRQRSLFFAHRPDLTVLRCSLVYYIIEQQY